VAQRSACRGGYGFVTVWLTTKKPKLHNQKFMKHIQFIPIIFLTLTSFAQIKEVTIKYEGQVENKATEKTAASSYTFSQTTYQKNSKSLNILSYPRFTITKVLDEKEILILMESGASKIYSRKSIVDLKNISTSKKPTPVITYTNEKKIILGYECKKILFSQRKASGKKQDMIAWVTEKIANYHSSNTTTDDLLPKTIGTILETYISDEKGSTKFVATNISTKAIPDKVFVVSTKGYREQPPRQIR
jgi:hypothetical protein